MQLALPEIAFPAVLTFDRDSERRADMLDDEKFWALCEANPDTGLERTPQGEVVIVPPAGGESDYRSAETVGQLHAWARRTRKGKVFGSTALFMLPDGSALSPDAAWVSNGRLAELTKAERRRFLRLVPEFVVEVRSPSDRLSTARKKMDQWIANGVELGWLVDGDARCVHVYRPGTGPVVHSGEMLAGEGPLEGLEFWLSELWDGL